MVGVGKDTLENHLHCLSVLRNKCAHTARMYNTDFNPPAKLEAYASYESCICIIVAMKCIIQGG